MKNSPDTSSSRNEDRSWLDVVRDYAPAVALGTATTAAGVGVARAAEHWLTRKAADKAASGAAKAAGAAARGAFRRWF